MTFELLITAIFVQYQKAHLAPTNEPSWKIEVHRSVKHTNSIQTNFLTGVWDHGIFAEEPKRLLAANIKSNLLTSKQSLNISFSETFLEIFNYIVFKV